MFFILFFITDFLELTHSPNGATHLKVYGSKRVFWRKDLCFECLVDTKSNLSSWGAENPKYSAHNADTPLKIKHLITPQRKEIEKNLLLTIYIEHAPYQSDNLIREIVETSFPVRIKTLLTQERYEMNEKLPQNDNSKLGAAFQETNFSTLSDASSCWSHDDVISGLQKALLTQEGYDMDEKLLQAIIASRVCPFRNDNEHFPD